MKIVVSQRGENPTSLLISRKGILYVSKPCLTNKTSASLSASLNAFGWPERGVGFNTFQLISSSREKSPFQPPRMIAEGGLREGGGCSETRNVYNAAGASDARGAPERRWGGTPRASEAPEVQGPREARGPSRAGKESQSRGGPEGSSALAARGASDTGSSEGRGTSRAGEASEARGSSRAGEESCALAAGCSSDTDTSEASCTAGPELRVGFDICCRALYAFPRACRHISRAGDLETPGASSI